MSCKNGMQDCRFTTDYRPNCDINESLFVKHKIPQANGTHFRVFLQNNAVNIMKDMRQSQQYENPTGCQCEYRPQINNLNNHKTHRQNPNDPRQSDQRSIHFENQSNCEIANNLDTFNQYYDSHQIPTRPPLYGNYPFYPAKFNCKSFTGTRFAYSNDFTA